MKTTYFPKIHKQREALLCSKLIRANVGGQIFRKTEKTVDAIFASPYAYHTIEIYICSNEKPNNGDKVLTDNYGIWEFRETPCPLPYWGNPNACNKIISKAPTEIIDLMIAGKIKEGDVVTDLVSKNYPKIKT